MSTLPDLDGLRAEQRAWASMAARDRAARLGDFVRYVWRERDRVEAVLVAESGKSSVDAGMELPMIAQILNYYGRRAPAMLAPVRPRSSSLLLANRRARVRPVPYGIVGIISPWNYPIANPLMDALPALLAGNAVLVKPSERTPAANTLLQHLWSEAGMPGVLAFAHGAGDVGEWVIDHSDFIQFTGSTSVGRCVAARAGARLVPVSLELGGKDAMIVLDDADLVRAARGAVWGAFFNAGQTCIAVERVYVDRSVKAQFLDHVMAEIDRLRLGPGRGTHVGCLIDERQLAAVLSQVDDAKRSGARVLRGGEVDGLAMTPTLIDEVDHRMALMRQETFGPVLPVMAFDDADDVPALVNDSPYGLSASIWTSSKHRARRLAEHLDVGTVLVNDVIANMLVLGAPMSGRKHSGIGSRSGGRAGLLKYCRWEVLVATEALTASEPTWYAAPVAVQRVSASLLARSALIRAPRSRRGSGRRALRVVNR